MKKGLYWFRNNHRLDDNPSLNFAVNNYDELHYIYVLDPSQFEDTAWSFPRMGTWRLAFLVESLTTLQTELNNKGAALTFKIGKPSEIIPITCKELGIRELVCSSEPAIWERNELQEVGQTLTIHQRRDGNLIDQLPFSMDMFPKGFSGFRKKVERHLNIRPTLSTPLSFPGNNQKLKSDPFPDTMGRAKYGALSLPGGEIAAQMRLHYYLHASKKVSSYKQTRNGMLGEDYSSKLSPFLAFGNISPVRIYHELKKYEEENQANESTYWLFFELVWREYFRYCAELYGSKMFVSQGVSGVELNPKWNKKLFQKWCKGETGNDFVDANMIELNQTGFMSNRGRQNVASFLIHELGQPWDAGAAYFEKQLIDYDPSANWGNWQYIAGVFSDGKKKIFDIEWQAAHYDPDGKYRSYWLNRL
ncbi:DASH family cryptochrome [Luteibaculum oceani]|uniref:Cryptochrome DASH n=1 Tax=Luteibaculum oceani TaxID=1294296 RepID=A0A5C6UUC7_9FLAO|nr:DASH family cryptochrome [Luteibaculum oceani]TXC76194.1 DASH family cryptochrome [Luteibaculum oceani]